MARIRTMKVYVVGEVARPGAYELSALATASNAIYAACGPSRSGSLRQIRIMREGKTVGQLDLYDFLLQGDRRQDNRLQAGDVVLVPPLGTCLLYTSDAADERSSVDLGGRRILKKNNHGCHQEAHRTSKKKKKRQSV